MITGHRSADPGVVSLGLTTDRVCLISTLFDKGKNLPAKFWGLPLLNKSWTLYHGEIVKTDEHCKTSDTKKV